MALMRDAVGTAMSRRAVAVVLMVVVLWAAPPRSAEAFDIIGLLREAARYLENINGVTIDINNRMAIMYPAAALREIRRWWKQAGSMREELAALSCDWRFSPRVDRAWRGLFSAEGFCKPEIEGLWGPAVPGPGADLEEWYEASSTTRLNALRTRFDHDEQWREYAGWLAFEAAQAGDPFSPVPYSPGYSQRLTAQGTALLGQMAIEAGDTRAMELWLREQQFGEERAEERRRRALGYVWMGFAAGKGLDELAARAEGGR